MIDFNQKIIAPVTAGTQRHYAEGLPERGENRGPARIS